MHDPNSIFFHDPLKTELKNIQHQISVSYESLCKSKINQDPSDLIAAASDLKQFSDLYVDALHRGLDEA